MIKNKKILTVLSTAAITGLLVAAVNSTAFAKASTIAVNSSDGKVYEYQYDALKASAVSQLMNGANDSGSKLYNDFSQRKTSINAYYDDVRKSYVSFDTIAKEAVNSMTKSISFNLNSFMESTTTPTTTITTNPVSVDVNGNLVINKQAVPSASAVDMTTLKCSNPVDSLSTLVSFKLSVSDPQNYTVTVKEKTASIDAATGNFTVYLDGKVLASDIKASDFTINKINLSDKPTVKSVAIIDSETIRVIFNKDVDFKYAHNPANYQLLDSDNVDISNHIKGIYSCVGESDTKNINTYNIKLQKYNPNNVNEDWRLTSSKYTLKIKNIRDTSSTPNVMDDYIYTINEAVDTIAPKGTGIYANMRGTGDKDKVVICFSEAMNSATLINKNNYNFINGEGDAKSLPSDVSIAIAGDNKSAILEFPSSYHVKTTGTTSSGTTNDVTAVTVFSVKDAAGNILDGVSYNNYNRINEIKAGATVKENTIRTFYDKDDYNSGDLYISVQFSRAVDSINKSDITFGGVVPSSYSIDGDTAKFKFAKDDKATADDIKNAPKITYANGKTNDAPTKIALVKAQGQNLKLAINATAGTIDEVGGRLSVANDGITALTLSDKQAKIYNNNARPRTTAYDQDTTDPGYWTATKDNNGGKVYITFDTPLDADVASADDFVFYGQDGSSIKASTATVSGNTVIFTFNKDIKNYSAFTDSLHVCARPSASFRSMKDAYGDYAAYKASVYDVKLKNVPITQ